VNLTLELLELIVNALRDHAGNFDYESEENETLHDAADALADAIDMLTESGRI
jgi:hypothetical protein